MTQKVTVSVVIPFFNRSHSIKRAVFSVIQQTLFDWECIVVNDGSCDRERDELIRILDGFDDCRIQLSHLEENRGGGAARNRGIELARGQFIAFLDSDDEWLPDKLFKQTALAKAHPNHVISCQSLVLHSGGKGVLPKQTDISGNVAEFLFVKNGWLPTPSLFLAAPDLRKIRFEEDLPRHQDYDLLFQLEKAGIKPIIIPEILVKVHWEENGTNRQEINYENSMHFLASRQSQFSRTSSSCFRVKFVAQSMMKSGYMLGGLIQIIRAGPLFVSNKQLAVQTLSILIFKDDRILSWIAKLFD